MTKKKRKVVDWNGRSLSSGIFLDCWVLKPGLLAPVDGLVVDGLLVDVAVLLAGQDRLGEEGQDPVEVHGLPGIHAERLN